MLPVVIILGKDIYLYGVFILCGTVALAATVSLRRRLYALPHKDTAWFCYFSFLGMIIGAKLIGLVSELPTFIHEMSLRSIASHFNSCPIVFYGGLLGALCGGFLYLKKRKIPMKPFFNMAIPACAIFHVFGRIGCAFGGCCYGVACSWGIRMATTPDIVRLPVQLFEAAFELFVFIILLIADKKKDRNINLATMYLALYAPFRFIIEFFRGDEIRGFFGIFSTSQWVSLIIMLCVAAMHIIAVLRDNFNREAASGMHK